MFIRIGGKLVYMPGINFEADAGGSSGSGGSADREGGDRDSGFKRLLERHQNDAIRVAEKLYDENHSHRESKRNLEAQIADLTGKVPAEGAVVLAGDDAAAWAAYRELGDLDALKAQLADKDRLAGELESVRRTELLRSVAETAGYKVAVLQQIAGDLNYAVEEVDQRGKKVPAVFVLEGENGATKTPIAKYMSDHFAEFLPVLKAKATQPTYGNGRGPEPAGVGNHARDAKDTEARRTTIQRAF